MAVIKKKRWYRIIAPNSFRNIELGETPSLEPGTLVGKNTAVNAMTIMNDPRKQHLRLTFKIKEVKADQAHTQLIKYEVVSSQIKRLSRKGSEKIEDSFTVKSKNGDVRVKPVFTTKSKINNSLKTNLRRAIQATIAEDIKEKTYDDFVLDVLNTKTHRLVKDSVKKIYPISSCEFKKIILEA